MMTTTTKFRRWDQKTIFNTLQKVVQIRDKIEEQAHEKEVNPADLPMSMLPTDVLYDMTSCFIGMYEKLLAKELLEAGYPKSDNTTQH